jgi:four helix bundle protein
MIRPQEDLRVRTKTFALSIIKLARRLPNNPEGWVLGKQILRSGTSVAANYRAAGCARSRAEFAAKIGIVLEEADETACWLEMMEAANLIDSATLQLLMREAGELVKIFSASYRTASANKDAR